MSDSQTAQRGPIDVLHSRSHHLLARVRAMLGDSARRLGESVDFVQEAWVDFLSSPQAHAAHGDDDLVRRFCAAARNNVRDACRRERPLGFDSIAEAGIDAREFECQETSAGSRLGRAEFAERLHGAAAELAPDLRAIVELHAFEGCSFVEVARRLGRHEDTVRKAYARALLQLSRRFGVA